MLIVQQILFRSKVDNPTLLIMNSLITYKDLKQHEIASRLVCFGVNGVNIDVGRLLFFDMVINLDPILGKK